MKKMLFASFTLAVVFIACNNKTEIKTSSSASNISLPYKAAYTTDFNDNVSDSDLLMILNTYKYWENGDLKALRATMSDSIYADLSEGLKFNGRSDTLMKIWQTYRDSLSSVKITMDVWRKNHSVKDSMDYITTWYKEIDTYKMGRVDSAKYADVNGIKNGKFVWYSQYRQKLK